MIAAGWAATFVIYPSIPPAADLNLLLDEAEAAWSEQSGAWAAFGADLLLGYEYRACIKLGTADLVLPGTGGVPEAAGARAATPDQVISEAFSRVCVDLRSLTEAGLYGYHRIPPAHRLWIWATDLDQARKDLPITPATG